MLRPSLLATVVALLGLTTAAITFPPSTCDAACRSNALAFLSGRCHRKLVANGPACIDAVAAQASSFCNSFLTPTTVSAVTTPSVTVTATDTSTSTTTTITTTTDVTATTSTTTTSTSTTTTYLSVSSLALRRGVRPTPACPDLSTPRLLRLAPTKVSSLCSLLGVTPSATTVSSTTTVTDTATTTVLTVETAVSLTTESTTSTTVTGVVATATRVVDHRFCEKGMGYTGGSAGGTGTSIVVPGKSGEECCRRCWETLNCAVSAPIGSGCQLVIATEREGVGAPSDTCPLGVWHWKLDGQGVTGEFYRGPCG